MKKINEKLTIVLFVFTTNFAVAQMNGMYGGMNRGGYGNGYGGMNNGSYSGMNRMNSIRPEETKPNTEDIIKTVAAKLKTELNLDELQVIAISNIISESAKSQGILIKKETDEASKYADLIALQEATDRKIMELLNKDQKAKYLLMIEDRKKEIEKQGGGRRRN